MFLGTTILSTTNRSPPGLPADRGDPLALEPELEAAGAARRDRERLHAIQGGNVDLGPEYGLGDADGNFDLEVLPLALEVGVGLDLDDDGQITGGRSLGTGLALTLEPELGPRIDPWRDLDDEAFRLAIGPLNLDGRLAPLDGGQERDGQVGFQRSAAALAARPAAAHPAHQVFKDARVPGVFTATGAAE